MGAALALPAGAQAADFTVTKLDDTDGVCDSGVDCSLREAITAASGSPLADDRVLFQAGLSGTITLGGTQLPVIDEPLQILGPGAGSLEVSGNDVSRIFEVDAVGSHVTIAGLTLKEGRASGLGGADAGGAIYAVRGELTIRDSTISSSIANYGGGVYNAFGSTTIEGSTISGNSADNRGGGVGANGVMTIRNSTISGNSAETYGGGAYVLNGVFTIEGSIVSGNEANDRGAGIASINSGATIHDSTISGNRDTVLGGGIHAADGTMTIERSTVTGNGASIGGGLETREGAATTIRRSTLAGNDAAVNGGGVYSLQAQTTIESSTILGNEAGNDGGGVVAALSPPADRTGLANTIVFGNSATTGPDLGGTDTFDAAFTLIGSTAGATLNETVPGSNIIGQDPQLGALADNGGPTETMALPPTSPAVNKGSGFGATTDQRGLPRPVDYPGVPFSTAAGADGADIGAFELQAPAPPPPPPVSNNFSFVGKPILNRRRGTAMLRVRVPGPGRVVLLRTPQLRRVIRNPAGARVVRLPVRARGKFRKRLLRTGRVRVRARVRFRPTGGTPRTKSRMVRLVKRKRR